MAKRKSKKATQTPDIKPVEEGVVTINKVDYHWEIRQEPNSTSLRLYMNGAPQRWLGTIKQIKAILGNYPMKTTIKPDSL
jgi:hypothetical protein